MTLLETSLQGQLVKMRSHWSRRGPDLIRLVPLHKGDMWTQTGTRRRPWGGEGREGVKCGQAEDGQQSRELGQAWDRSSLTNRCHLDPGLLTPGL